MDEIDNTPGERMRGYTTDMTDEEVRQEFKKRFGFEPEKIVRTEGAVNAGPIDKK